MPTVVLRYQQKLKLKPLQVNILLQLLSYWWEKDNLPRPGKNALAATVGVDPSTVRRCLKKLEEVGYLKRIERRKSNKASQPNEYNLQGLIDALQPFAAEEHEEIRKRKARQIQRLAGKKPSLQLVKR
jgi:DNA-binding transcriptional regulator YhcF (GntR family)